MINLLRTLLFLSILLTPVLGFAADKVALVIGNSSYEHATPLENTVNDARDIAFKLRNMGFEVTEGINLTGQETRLEMGRFVQRARTAEIAVVYYAGHGIEIDGRNYLIPVDATMASEDIAVYETNSLEDLISAARPAGSLAVVLVDACRNNPFLATMTRNAGTRSGTRGLAPIDIEATSADTGLIVSFATQPGQLAADGEGRNSPFAQALLSVIDLPGVEIERMFRTLRARVIESSNGVQRPVYMSELPERSLYLVPPQDQEGPSPATDDPTTTIDESETQLATAIATAQYPSDPDLLRSFLQENPNHPEAAMLRRRLSVHEDEQAWEVAKTTGGQAALRRYLALYPSGIYAPKAHSLLSEKNDPVVEDTASIDQLISDCFDAALSAENMLGRAGVRKAEINSTRAFPACLAAYQEAPSNPAILHSLGRVYAVDSQYEKALELYIKAAALDHFPSIYSVGAYHYSGIATPVDIPAAKDLWDRAHELGSGSAAYGLAVLYGYGRYVTQDEDKAVELLLSSIQLGSSQAIERSATFSISIRRKLQEALARRGLYQGGIDGAFGPGTLAAMRELASGN